MSLQYPAAATKNVRFSPGLQGGNPEAREGWVPPVSTVAPYLQPRAAGEGGAAGVHPHPGGGARREAPLLSQGTPPPAATDRDGGRGEAPPRLRGGEVRGGVPVLDGAE